MEMDSFKKISEDAVVTDAGHARSVASLSKEFEGMLLPEAKAKATRALCELSVLNVLQPAPRGSPVGAGSIRKVGGRLAKFFSFESSHVFPFTVANLGPIAHELMQ